MSPATFEGLRDMLATSFAPAVPALGSVGATQTGNLAERQIDLMVDPHRNGGLPPMLTPCSGEQHAVQGLQVVATAMVAAMRRACTPASMQSIPTNLHNQDVVPFGTQAALTALDQARSLRLLHGCLGIVLRQAAYLQNRAPTAPRCKELLSIVAEAVAPIERDRPLDNDIRLVADRLDQYMTERFPVLNEPASDEINTSWAADDEREPRP